MSVKISKQFLIEKTNKKIHEKWLNSNFIKRDTKSSYIRISTYFSQSNYICGVSNIFWKILPIDIVLFRIRVTLCANNVLWSEIKMLTLLFCAQSIEIGLSLVLSSPFRFHYPLTNCYFRTTCFLFKSSLYDQVILVSCLLFSFFFLRSKEYYNVLCNIYIWVE